MRIVPAGLLALLLAALGVTSAHAASVSVSYHEDTVVVPGVHSAPSTTYQRLLATVRFIGDPAGDDVTVARRSTTDPFTVDIHDAGASVAPAGPCTSIDDQTVRCRPFATPPPDSLVPGGGRRGARRRR